MKISACVITKNEEKNIARSINSYQSIVDEIIVVDSESTDDTVAIAESLGAKVYTRSWTNDFAAAKNYALDQASGDWIIFLDADEYLAKGYDAIVYEMLERIDHKDIDTVLSPLTEIQDAEDRVFGKCYVERIFRNRPHIRYVNKIHECLLASGKTPKRHFTEEILAYHTGYRPDGNVEKVKRNLAILNDPATKLHDPRQQYFYLISSYHGLGMHREALREYRILLEIEDFRSIVVERYHLFRVYIFAVHSMLALGEEYEEEQVMQTFRLMPAELMKHPEIQYLQYECFLRYQRVDEAIDAFEKALILHETDDSGYENLFANNIAHKYAAAANLYKLKNLPQQAIRLFCMALKENKDNEEYLCELLLLLEEETSQKQEIIEAFYDVNDIGDLCKVIRGAWIAGSHDLFAIYFLHMIKRWPSKASEEKDILSRVFLLQKNYDGIIKLAAEQPENTQLQQLSLIASTALYGKPPVDNDVNSDFVLGVILILLQVKQDQVLDQLLKSSLLKKQKEWEKARGKMALAVTFEKYRQWTLAGRFYQEAAEVASDQKDKGSMLLSAARMAYYEGDFDNAMDLLDKATPHVDRENNLPDAIRGWIRERMKGGLRS